VYGWLTLARPWMVGSKGGQNVGNGTGTVAAPVQGVLLAVLTCFLLYARKQTCCCLGCQMIHKCMFAFLDRGQLVSLTCIEGRPLDSPHPAFLPSIPPIN
jgi:hypothetical protein